MPPRLDSAPPAVVTDDASVRAVATEGFAEILHIHGISLAVSTDRIGRVALVRASSPATMEMTLRPFRKPFGIAVGPDRIVIASEREVCDFRRDEGHFLPRGRWHTGAIDVHEM